jgi:hypothetical protein
VDLMGGHFPRADGSLAAVDVVRSEHGVFVRSWGDGDLHARVFSREGREFRFEEFAVKGLIRYVWALVGIDAGRGERSTYFMPRLLPAQSQ